MNWRAAVVITVVLVSACSGGPRYEGRSLPAWIADLKSPDAEVQRRAMAACAAMGPDAKAAIPALVEALKSKGPMWSMAGVALSRMGEDAYAAVRPIAGNPDPGVRREAVRTIGKLAEAKADDGGATSELVQHLADPDAEVRAVAAAYLGVVHREAGVVVPVLAHATEDASALVRMNACTALAMFGKESAPAVPELRRALADSNKDVRAAAERALLYHSDSLPK